MRLLELTVRSVKDYNAGEESDTCRNHSGFSSALTNEWLRFDRAMVDHATPKLQPTLFYYWHFILK